MRSSTWTLYSFILMLYRTQIYFFKKKKEHMVKVSTFHQVDEFELVILWMLRFVCSSISDIPYISGLVAFPDELRFISSLYHVYMFKLHPLFKNYANSSLFFGGIRVTFLFISIYDSLPVSVMLPYLLKLYISIYLIDLDLKLTTLSLVKNQAQCFSHI